MQVTDSMSVKDQTSRQVLLRASRPVLLLPEIAKIFSTPGTPSLLRMQQQ
jgi:hypothetical protein